MRTCAKCNFENPDEVKFCGQCGNELTQLKQEEPVEQILAQSESYGKELDYNWESENDRIKKTIKKVEYIALAVCLLPIVINLFNDKRVEEALYEWITSIFPWLYVAVTIVLWRVQVSVINKAEYVYDVWKRYCQNESLVVSNIGVYGQKSDGAKIQLSYKNIKSVSTNHYVSTETGSMKIVSNDVLVIRDLNNKAIEFKTFTNARKLQTMIEMQKKC